MLGSTGVSGRSKALVIGRKLMLVVVLLAACGGGVQGPVRGDGVQGAERGGLAPRHCRVVFGSQGEHLAHFLQEKTFVNHCCFIIKLLFNYV